MPDFERLTDQFRLHIGAKSGFYSQEYVQGFIDGKTKARIEIAVIIAIAAFIFSIIKYLY